ncbi:MAG: amidase [Alphaproteobacteria bacterium]|nr:MAG: amidase [Alphaproteobacteria bacterium]
MSDLWRLSASELAKGIREKKYSSEEATRSALSRMAEANPAINAVTQDLSEGALEDAKAADAALQRGDDIGPLHGVPITIKENVDQKGWSNTNGIPALDAIIAQSDSPVVDNLRKAGSVIIGRTNVPEFSLRWFSTNPLRGQTLNPWNKDITPGGSSGGAASSLASGIGALAHGNDIGGSLRYPAYSCGIVALRPSLGRIPSYNASAPGDRLIAMTLMAVQGPMARTVADVRLGLEVMSEGSADDPWWAPAPVLNSNKPVKVAVSSWPNASDCAPSVQAALKTTADALQAAGYEVEQVDPPVTEEVMLNWQALITTEIRLSLMDVARQVGSPDINKFLNRVLELTPELDLAGYAQALAMRTGLIRAWQNFMKEYPLVVLPVSKAAPFAQDADLDEARVPSMLLEQAPLYAMNLLGLPSIALPTGLVDGLPTGVQIVGRKFHEADCLDAAEVVEAEVGMVVNRLWG